MLPLHQACLQTAAHDLFEHSPKHTRLAKASVSILRERRVIRNLLLEVQPREPTIGQMHPDFFQQTTLTDNPVEVAQQQQSQQHLGINRGPTGRTVEALHSLTHKAQIDLLINDSEKVVLGNLVL